jgi:hypothetical protein
MRQIKESDWKLFRQVHSEALERFCKQILSEVERVNSDRTKGFHEKYLDIWRVLKRRDKEMARSFDDIRRSTAWNRLASIKELGLLTEDEFLRFSEETREVVGQMLGINT